MKNRFCWILLGLVSLVSSVGFAQEEGAQQRFEAQMENSIRAKWVSDYDAVRPFFEEAYALHATIPRGLLEAVAFQYTRFSRNRGDDEEEEDSASMPRTYSIMGLTADGKGVFRENMRMVSDLSGVPVEDIRRDGRWAVLAYAAAFARLQHQYGLNGPKVEQYAPIFLELCELPQPDTLNMDRQEVLWSRFALNSFLYEIYVFLSDTAHRGKGIPAYSVDFKGLFGEGLDILSNKTVTGEALKSVGGVSATDYPGAIWNPAASCNYSSGRGGTAISNVTIHYTSGTYAGAIAWFGNCNARASAHYVIRSMDGQITQMVREADKAWHVGSANSYTIGIEHEAYGNVWSYFTPQMYQSSADLVRNITSRYSNMSPHRVFYRDTLDYGTALNDGLHSLGGSTACTQIRGHQHFPSQTHTDPGPYWNWNYYYKLINPNPNVVLFTDSCGSFTDSGGAGANYGNDERKVYHIHVAGADSIVLDFTSFALEPNYDFLWIYAGSSVFDPQVGRWNTHSPGRVMVPGEDVVLEFRSDCATTAAGWEAMWHGCFPVSPMTDTSAPTTQILLADDTWQTKDFTVAYQDTDDVALRHQFYQVMEYDGVKWTANPYCGFLCDNFDTDLDTLVWQTATNCSVENQQLKLDAVQSGNAWTTARLNGQAHKVFLYDFYLTWVDGSDASFYFHCDAPPTPNTTFSGYKVRFARDSHAIRLCRVDNGAEQLLCAVNNAYLSLQQPYRFRVVLDRNTGEILLFKHAVLLCHVRDSAWANVPWSANCLAFASDASTVNVDNVRVYGSRGSQTRITVGADDTCMVRYQSWQGSVAAKVKSIVLDRANKFSSLEEKRVKVDFSPPSMVDMLKVYSQMVNDNAQNVTLSWLGSKDPHSDVKQYEYMIVSPNPRDYTYRNGWRNLGLATSVQVSVDCRQVPNVMIQVRAENNAGLKSSVAQHLEYCRCHNNILTKQFAVFPNPARDELEIEVRNVVGMEMVPVGERTVRLYDLAGRVLKEATLDQRQKLSLEGCPPGIYMLQVLQGGRILLCEKVVKIGK